MTDVNGFNVQALDDGYGDVKYLSNGKGVLLPSFVTPFKPKPEDLFSKGSDHSSYISSEIDGMRYTIGEYASKLDPSIKWIGGENKHVDSRFPVLFKTVLGLMTPNPVENIDLLVMNLPIKYDTPERRDFLESVAVDTHKVAISYDGIEFSHKKVSVNKLIVKKQPFGSLCDLILDDCGDIQDYDLAKGFNVIIDIGARTLNILTVEGLEEQPHLTIQTNDGMFEAYRQVADYLENALGTIIPEGKLPQIIRSRTVKDMDLTPLIDYAFQNLANNILSILDRVLINSWGFVTSIIFTGGGTELLKTYLEERMKNKNIRIITMNRYSNVKGLGKFGRRCAKNMEENRSVLAIGRSGDTCEY